MDSSIDDWNRHWQDFGAASDAGPTPKYRSRIILRLLNIKGAGESVRLVELGSGYGEFASFFQRQYPNSHYIGLEISKEGIAAAQNRVPTATFVQQDLLAESVLPLSEYQATHAVCSEVLEHVDAPARLVANARKYMAPNCRFVVTVPGGPLNAFYRRIGHRRHYTSREIADILRAEGFVIERAYDAGFPFYNCFRWLLTLRGDGLVNDVSRTPSALMRAGLNLFGWLFHFNLMRWGWQVFVVARLD